MKIYVRSKKFFESIKGTPVEKLYVSQYNIISINSPVLHPHKVECPPFSPENLSKSNILILNFHDTDKPATDCVLFSEQDVDKIIQFINTIDKNKPLIVHCTAGISRSGAIGYCLNEYFNRMIDSTESTNEDYNQFQQLYNNTIIPNILVKRLLLNRLTDIAYPIKLSKPLTTFQQLKHQTLKVLIFLNFFKYIF